jgi:hypothetical protein
MLLLKAIQRVCVVDMTNLTKVYESVVLAEATKLCKWSGNGKFYAPVIYNLSFPAKPTAQDKKKSTRRWSKGQMQYALLAAIAAPSRADDDLHPEKTTIVVMEPGIPQ